MNTEDFKFRLGHILAKEEASEVDWAAVAALCAELAADPDPSSPPAVADYLTSVERRRQDNVFGHAQRSALVGYLNAGPTMPRKRARVGVNVEVMLRRTWKTNYRVRMFDASPEGCKLEFIERPDLGETLWVKFEDVEMLEARVCWTEGFTAGVEFLKPIHPAVFDHLIKKLG